MVTTATLQVFKNCAYDIYRNMSNFTSLSAQNAYYNGLTKLEKDVVFNKIGDPFILDEDIATLSEYSYGRIQYAGMWWYFQIMDMAVNAQGRTVVSYQLDAWETHRYQGNLKLGAGHITRSYGTTRVYRPNYEPDTWAIQDDTDRDDANALTSGGYNPCVLGFMRDNTTDWCYFVCLDIEESERNAFLANISALAKYVIDAMANVSQNLELIGLWYSSFAPPLTGSLSRWTSSEHNNVYYISATKEDADLTNTLRASFKLVSSSARWIENTIGARYFIADERGNPVFEFADNVYYSPTVTMILNMTMSSCQWLCTIGMSESQSGTADLISYASFTIDCEPMDYYNDSWATYQATQRQMDIDMRSLENTNNAVGGATSATTNAINGALTGAMVGAVGGPIGAGVGAVAGLATSLIATGVSTLYNSSYAHPKEQEIIDNNYKRSADMLSLSGNGVNGSLWVWMNRNENISLRHNETAGAGYKKLIANESFMNLYESDVNVYGYYCNIITDDVDSEIADGGFTAVCEVTGVPANWAGQVQERLANGVMFK